MAKLQRLSIDDIVLDYATLQDAGSHLDKDEDKLSTIAQ